MHSFQHREISKYKYSTVQQYKKEQYYQEKYEKMFKENIFKMRICMIIMSKKQSDPHKFTESEFFTWSGFPNFREEKNIFINTMFSFNESNVFF